MKVFNIVGARPNFIKIAPLMAAMKRSALLEPILIHTGQHYDTGLSTVFFDQLGIPQPDYHLEVGSAPREEQIARIQQAFEPLVKRQPPDLVLVVGDVNSTIACAEVAARNGIRVAHVEAGLRSFDTRMPEELNRIATDKISDFLFATEEAALVNLCNEEIAGKVFLVGNVMIDTLVANLAQIQRSTITEQLEIGRKPFFIATFHRPSNVDELADLTRVVEALQFIAARMTVVFPLHPRTRHSLSKHGLLERMRATPQLIMVDPLGYHDFIKLIQGSAGVLTDSGGIQEETTYLQVPCITMRENTERPVTQTIGSNTLVGEQFDRVYPELEQIFGGHPKKGSIPPLWDGTTAERIVRILEAEMKTA